jgi:hypothetical protein
MNEVRDIEDDQKGFPVRIRAIVLMCIVCLPLASRPALAWYQEGHILMTRGGMSLVGDRLPEFFVAGVGTITHCVVDPDYMKHPAAAQLRDAENPEHYLDLELLEGREMPPTRYAYLELVGELGVKPDKAGTLPYAVSEAAQRLELAFAEYRRWPDNPHIRAKCLDYAGWLSHYAQDLEMPLHTTIHWDGRAVEGEKYQRTGIHAKVDDLPHRFTLDEVDWPDGETIEPAEDVFAAVVAELHEAHGHVDAVYAIESDLPEVKATAELTPAVRRFGLERIRRGGIFTARLYLTAWRRSADIELPDWLDRASLDEDSGLDRAAME